MCALDKEVQIAIANEIRNQIGGQQAIFMLGNPTLTCEPNGGLVLHKIKGCKLYNYIYIHLNGMDLYDITFKKIIMKDYLPHTVRSKVVEDVYNDMLPEIITKETGLALEIPLVKGINC